MIDTRKFTVAGFSTMPNGIRKLRFTSSDLEGRVKLLERQGHTNVDLRQLPYPMDKLEAMNYLGIRETDELAPKGVRAQAARLSKTFEMKRVNAKTAETEDQEVTA